MAHINSVDDYIDSQPLAAQAVLLRVRSAIRKALPAAEEAISYNMPAYKIGDRAVLYFAGWKRHYALYPFGDRLVQAFREELSPYEIKKSTLHLPLSEPAPVKLIERIAKFRANEEAAKASASPAADRSKVRRTRI